ncbi:MAG: patatin-like phospholipase RssA [Betaproteobacteria bacterium]|nr:patatin-like phospholipase RssA [Betaproteobacteria bacterium]MDE2212208.1 patatin-like phospholipase RssA [Betaproteobacteria bacterium]
MTTKRKPCIGLALGGGSARGWAHVGVIRALEEAGIRPDLVCGTSVGAMVGAAYAAGELDRFEQWLLDMSLRDVFSFMDVSLNGGMLKGDRLMEFFRTTFVDHPIEGLKMPFAAVATSLQTGAEVWLREGSTVDAVRASIALPLLFTPVQRDGVFLVDGGLVNPVPVSLARAMGADFVIAVDLSADIVGHRLHDVEPEAAPQQQSGGWLGWVQDRLGMPRKNGEPVQTRLPSVLEVMSSSINIMQVRITRSRMAGEPPDVTISPRLAHFGLFDFHRAQEAIAAGRLSVEASRHGLQLMEG